MLASNPYFNTQAEFMANVGHFPNLRVHRSMSHDFATSVDSPVEVDMVFIDGGHSRDVALQDMRDWWPRCRKVFCGHDAWMEGVKEALNEFSRDGWRMAVGEIWTIEVQK